MAIVEFKDVTRVYITGDHEVKALDNSTSGTTTVNGKDISKLKVLGFRDKAIGRLLISQNIWLAVIGVLLGIPAGAGILHVLVAELAGEYELSLTLGAMTYVISIALTFGVSLLAGLMVSRKNKKIYMVEALKGTK